MNPTTATIPSATAPSVISGVPPFFLICNATNTKSTIATTAITRPITERPLAPSVGPGSSERATLNAVPAPKISRINPIMVKPRVNPSPIPIPSNAEDTTSFLDA